MFQELERMKWRLAHELDNREPAEVVARTEEYWRRGWVPPPETWPQCQKLLYKPSCIFVDCL